MQRHVLGNAVACAANYGRHVRAVPVAVARVVGRRYGVKSGRDARIIGGAGHAELLVAAADAGVQHVHVHAAACMHACMHKQAQCSSVHACSQHGSHACRRAPL